MTGEGLDISAVTRPGAFFGRVTLEVRRRAARLLDGYNEGRTLDVGCGNGLFFASLGATAQRYFGLDGDSQLLLEARAVFADNRLEGVCLTRGDARALPFRDASFDNVFFLNTFVNIPDWASAAAILDELTRVCRPGGRLIADIRNAANPVLFLRYRWHNRKADFVTRGHRLRKLRRALRARGFEGITAHVVGPRLPFCGWAFLLEAIRPASGWGCPLSRGLAPREV